MMGPVHTGSWMRPQSADPVFPKSSDDGRGSRYRCTRCDVTWVGGVAEHHADYCWLCALNDRTEVWCYGGRPWVFPMDKMEEAS